MAEKIGTKKSYISRIENGKPDNYILKFYKKDSL
jgi:transcriptional regulator with XRE-family HTH domain